MILKRSHLSIYPPLHPPDTPAALCDVCGGEIWWEELAHLIDGRAVCADCFFDFAFDYFTPQLMTGTQLNTYRGGGSRKGRYI